MLIRCKNRQRTNEIIANKKAFFGPFARGDTEEENGSVASEADLMNGEYILSIPNENNIQKFENDLIVNIFWEGN